MSVHHNSGSGKEQSDDEGAPRSDVRAEDDLVAENIDNAFAEEGNALESPGNYMSNPGDNTIKTDKSSATAADPSRKGRRQTLSAGMMNRHRNSIIGQSLAHEFRRAAHQNEVRSLTVTEKTDMRDYLLGLPFDEQLSLLIKHLKETPPRKFWHIRCLSSFFSPNLFRNEMSDHAIQAVVDNITIQQYLPGEVIFKQGENADGYYSVIQGDACVYRIDDPVVDVEGLSAEAQRCGMAETKEKRRLFGKFVAELEPRSAFGESASKRAATVLAGSWGPSNSSADGESIFHTSKDGTILFRVPPHIYSAHLARDTSDVHWNEKINFLKKNFLFAHMSDFERAQIASAMIKPHGKVTNGTVLSRYKEPISDVVMLAAGEVRVSVPHTICEQCVKEAAEREKSPLHLDPEATKKHSKCKYTKTSTEIGRLYGPDILFLEEMYDGKSVASQRVVCSSQKVSIYLVSQEIFNEWLQKADEAKKEKARKKGAQGKTDADNWIVTLDMVKRLVEQRKEYSKFRTESRLTHPKTTPVNVTKIMMQEGEFCIMPESLLTNDQKEQLRQQRRQIEHTLTLVRADIREAREALKTKRLHIAHAKVRAVSTKCALFKAELKDAPRVSDVQHLMEKLEKNIREAAMIGATAERFEKEDEDSTREHGSMMRENKVPPYVKSAMNHESKTARGALAIQSSTLAVDKLQSTIAKQQRPKSSGRRSPRESSRWPTWTTNQGTKQQFRDSKLEFSAWLGGLGDANSDRLKRPSSAGGPRMSSSRVAGVLAAVSNAKAARVRDHSGNAKQQATEARAKAAQNASLGGRHENHRNELRVPRHIGTTSTAYAAARAHQAQTTPRRPLSASHAQRSGGSRRVRNLHTSPAVGGERDSIPVEPLPTKKSQQFKERPRSAPRLSSKRNSTLVPQTVSVTKGISDGYDYLSEYKNYCGEIKRRNEEGNGRPAHSTFSVMTGQQQHGRSYTY